MHTLEAIGFHPQFQEELRSLADPGLAPARVVIEYQDRFRLLGADGPLMATLSGNLRHEAEADRLRRPAVGDWVAVRHDEGQDMASILRVLERRTCFVRQAAGRRLSPQVVAANIDVVFVVTSCGRDFNPRRIERYLTTVVSSGAEPVIVLNKLDLCDDPTPYIKALETAAPGVTAILVSALERRGLDELARSIQPGRTVALVGSSGVGKSTLVNWLVGQEVQDVGEVREHDERGRHTTTHRELIVIPGGGILIDTPGMRELQLWSEGLGIGEAFADIQSLAEKCRFRDCLHQKEPGCAIREAVGAGELDPERLQSYLKLLREHESQEARRSQSSTGPKRGKQAARLLRQMKNLRGR